MWSGVWNTVTGKAYTPGDVQMITFGFVFAVFSLTMVAPNIGLVKTGKLSAAKLLKVINRKPKIHNLDGRKILHIGNI